MSNDRNLLNTFTAGLTYKPHPLPVNGGNVTGNVLASPYHREGKYDHHLEKEIFMPPDPRKVRAVQLNLEGLIRLLGGSAEDRQRFWEIHKGITTPVEIRLVNAQLDGLAAQTKALQASTKALQDTAKQIARRG